MFEGSCFFFLNLLEFQKYEYFFPWFLPLEYQKMIENFKGKSLEKKKSTNIRKKSVNYAKLSYIEQIWDEFSSFWKKSSKISSFERPKFKKEFHSGYQTGKFEKKFNTLKNKRQLCWIRQNRHEYSHLEQYLRSSDQMSVFEQNFESWFFVWHLRIFRLSYDSVIKTQKRI